MKRLKIALSLCFVSYLSFSQTDTKENQIDIIAGYLGNSVIQFVAMDGGGSVENGKGFCLGINYNRKVAKSIWINSGIIFQRTLNDRNPAPTGLPTPTIENIETEMLRIPLKVRIDFLKRFYLRTGFLIDTEISNKNESGIDNQSGIGYSLGVGLNLKIADTFILNIEPELGFSTLVPFNQVEYQEHFLLHGVNFSVGYRF